MASLLTFDRKQILSKPFFESQFKYCPLIWMFCSRRASNIINKLHKRALRLVYDDYKASFFDLLAINSLFTVHHTNIQTLLLKMYKIKHNLSENCLTDPFSAMNDHYNLSSQSKFGVPGINTVFYRANSIR